MRSFLTISFTTFLLASVFPGMASANYRDRLANPEFLADTLGEGSVLEQTRQLDLGLERKVTYCDGKPTGFWGYYVSRDCCTLNVNSMKIADSDDLKLEPKRRDVSFTMSVDGKSLVAALDRAELYFTCSAGAVTQKEFVAAFGGLFEVIVAKPVNPEALVKKISLPMEQSLPSAIDL